MDRRLLFPIIAGAVWTQTSVAQSPAPTSSEAALRSRAEEFYKLEQDKKFRQAEAFVAEDTKDYYFNNGKPDIRKFAISKVELNPDGTEAKLTLNITSVMVAPAMGAMEFTSPTTATWKLENGQWMWHFVQATEVDTPFGKWKVGDPNAGPPPNLPIHLPDPAKLRTSVSIDRTSVELGSGAPETVTITNHLPGAIDLIPGKDVPKGLVMTMDKKSLGPEEKAVISFSATGGLKPSGTVLISAGVLQDFLIQIRTK